MKVIRKLKRRLGSGKSTPATSESTHLTPAPFSRDSKTTQNRFNHKFVFIRKKQKNLSKMLFNIEKKEREQNNVAESMRLWYDTYNTVRQFSQR